MHEGDTHQPKVIADTFIPACTTQRLVPLSTSASWPATIPRVCSSGHAWPFRSVATHVFFWPHHQGGASVPGGWQHAE